MKKKLHIIGIAETFLTSEIQDSEIQISGYKIYRKDREFFKKGKGGGVIMYVMDEITSFADNALNEKKTESVWCIIKTDSSTEIIVGTCYRSQAAEAGELKDLFYILEQVSNREALIMGDFNYPGINWATMGSDSAGNDFKNLILDCYLYQHVKEPTREHNILDLVITSSGERIDNVDIEEPLGSSDHNSLLWEYKCNIPSINRPLYYRQYNKTDWASMRAWLENVDWNVGEGLSTADADSIKLTGIIKIAVDKFVPLKRRSRNKKPKWMNKKAISAMNNKTKMWKKHKQLGTDTAYAEYKKSNNKATKAYRAAKIEFENKLSSEIKENPRGFYAYVRSKTKVKDIVGPLKEQNGRLLTEPEEICSELNEYFSSVFTVEMDTINLPEVDIRSELNSSHIMNVIEIGPSEVLLKLNKLKEDKAPGVDDIVPSVLKRNANELCMPLSKIFTKSLETSIVPSEWRKANVTAIYKGGARELAQNYRPISLTSHACKILESIVKDKIVQYLEANNLIRSSQHGFVAKRSCLTNLLEFYECVSNYIDQGYPIDVIYLDFQKAFDKVPHKRLMLKVRALGIDGTVCNWIEKWLENREQRVVLLGKYSEWKKVKSGVPQGSVLGPLLFLVYINDIDCDINNNILKFADDTKLFGVAATRGDVQKLQNDLDRLYFWSEEWLMLFNVKKCKVMHLGYNNGLANYTMNGNVLESVVEERDLGIIFQNNLKWEKQCAKAVNTANRILGMIKRNFVFLNRENFLLLYKSLVRPHLEYCIQVWCPHLKKDIELLENVQRRATKLVKCVQNMSYEERLKYFKLTTLETRRMRGDLIETFKILKHKENVNVENFFKISASDRTRGHSLKLIKNLCHLDLRKFAFSRRVINLWNALPQDVIACDTINSFKNNLDKFMNGRGFK